MPQLDQIRIAIIHGPSDSIEAALDVIKSFQDLPEITDDTGVQEVMLKNTVETEWIVDKDHKYYLNAPLPWFGSGSLTQELNPDGTLAKATSTADTKLADGISSFIPFKEYLSGRFVKVFDDKDEENKTDASILLADNTQALKMIGQKGQNNFIVTLSLNIEEVGHEYTFTRVAETKSELQSNISFDTENNSFSRNSIGFLVQAAIETDDGTLVGITGSIKFPKDWGVPKPADPKAP